MGDVNEPQSWDNMNFTEKLWSLDTPTLIQRFIATTQTRDAGDAHAALTILQAKATVAAQEAAEQSKRVATATMWLASQPLSWPWPPSRSQSKARTVWSGGSGTNRDVRTTQVSTEPALALDVGPSAAKAPPPAL